MGPLSGKACLHKESAEQCGNGGEGGMGGGVAKGVPRLVYLEVFQLLVAHFEQV